MAFVSFAVVLALLNLAVANPCVEVQPSCPQPVEVIETETVFVEAPCAAPCPQPACPQPVAIPCPQPACAEPVAVPCPEPVCRAPRPVCRVPVPKIKPIVVYSVAPPAFTIGPRASVVEHHAAPFVFNHFEKPWIVKNQNSAHLSLFRQHPVVTDEYLSPTVHETPAPPAVIVGEVCATPAAPCAAPAPVAVSGAPAPVAVSNAPAPTPCYSCRSC